MDLESEKVCPSRLKYQLSKYLDKLKETIFFFLFNIFNNFIIIFVINIVGVFFFSFKKKDKFILKNNNQKYNYLLFYLSLLMLKYILTR